MKADSSWRIFCAIEIPEDVSLLALKQIEKLKSEFPRVSASWTREGKIHLTLKFLGNIQHERVADVTRATALATTGIAPFEISIGEAGAFPKRGSPRVIWIGVDDSSGKLGKLQENLEKECDLKGFAREERAFHPHLTLARLRDSHGARELSARHRELGFDSISIKVKELLVLRSELSPKGSKYTLISSHPLAG